MSEFRDLLRENNFFARGVAFGMIPAFFKISLFVGKWWSQGELISTLFGAPGILLGAFVGHQLYYRWIFPEKRQPNGVKS